MRGFDEELSPEEDVDLCWRLQLAGYEFTATSDAVVEKRERAGVRPMFHAVWLMDGVGRGSIDDIVGMACGATYGGGQGFRPFVAASPGLIRPTRRRQWARTFGIRAGRLAGSVTQHAFFP